MSISHWPWHLNLVLVEACGSLRACGRVLFSEVEDSSRFASSRPLQVQSTTNSSWWPDEEKPFSLNQKPYPLVWADRAVFKSDLYRFGFVCTKEAGKRKLNLWCLISRRILSHNFIYFLFSLVHLECCCFSIGFHYESGGDLRMAGYYSSQRGYGGSYSPSSSSSYTSPLRSNYMPVSFPCQGNYIFLLRCLIHFFRRKSNYSYGKATTSAIREMKLSVFCALPILETKSKMILLRTTLFTSLRRTWVRKFEAEVAVFW